MAVAVTDCWPEPEPQLIWGGGKSGKEVRCGKFKQISWRVFAHACSHEWPCASMGMVAVARYLCHLAYILNRCQSGALARGCRGLNADLARS